MGILLFFLTFDYIRSAQLVPNNNEFDWDRKKNI